MSSRRIRGKASSNLIRVDAIQIEMGAIAKPPMISSTGAISVV